MIKTEALRRRERRQALLTVVFTIISVIYLMPVLLVLINSLKANAFVNTETFKLPTAESFVGLKNYVKGMTFGNFAFYKVVFYSFFITITLLPVELRIRLLTGQPAQGIKSIFERERSINNPNAGCRWNLLRQKAQ